MRHHYLAGPGDLPEEKTEEFSKLGMELLSAHTKATVCDITKTNCELYLEPDLTDILHYSKDYDELAYYWTAWHDQTGANLPAEKYARFFSLKNEQAQYAGFANYAEQAADTFNTFSPDFSFESFKQQMTEVWTLLKPYYMKLHAWVRFKLTNYYGPKITHPLGLIPAHLFGNMWAQEWNNIENITTPYPDLPSIDATNAMREAVGKCFICYI
jgi:peptidyl-dipeptidase A